MKKHEKWNIVFLFGMDTKKVSFQPCDASQAGKVEDCLKGHGIHIFPDGRVKTEVCLAYQTEIDFLESKVIEALRESLEKLGIKDASALDIHKDKIARKTEEILASEGIASAKLNIEINNPVLAGLIAR